VQRVREQAAAGVEDREPVSSQEVSMPRTTMGKWGQVQFSAFAPRGKWGQVQFSVFARGFGPFQRKPDLTPIFAPSPPPKIGPDPILP